LRDSVGNAMLRMRRSASRTISIFDFPIHQVVSHFGQAPAVEHGGGGGGGFGGGTGSDVPEPDAFTGGLGTVSPKKFAAPATYALLSVVNGYRRIIRMSNLRVVALWHRSASILF
jgi:hypothetical protein